MPFRIRAVLSALALCSIPSMALEIQTGRKAIDTTDSWQALIRGTENSTPRYQPSSVIRLRALTQNETIGSDTPIIVLAPEDIKESRIHGGEEVQQGRYPYLAALFQRTTWGAFQQVCGGVLIAPKVILTAAHCLEYIDVVMLGVHDFRNIQGSSYELYSLSPKSTLRYPLYDPYTLDGDFALVFLPEPSKFAPVTVNANGDVPSTDQKLTVMGWGTTEHGALSNVPLETTVDVLSNMDCANRYGSESHISKRMVCASGGSERDSCQEDSGGPLIIKGQDAADDILVGLVSWGYECSGWFYPGVYSRVSAATFWLKHNVPEVFDDSVTVDDDAAFASPANVPDTQPTRNCAEPSNCWSLIFWSWCDHEVACNPSM